MSGFGGLSPVDYSGLQNRADPLAGFAQGYAQTAQIQQIAAAKRAAEAAAIRKAQMEDYLDALASNPSAKGSDYARAALRFPEAGAELKQAWEIMAPEQRENEFTFAGGLYSALGKNKPELAIKQARTRAQALRNSGMEDEAAEYDELADLIAEDPVHARAAVGYRLASVDPEKFGATLKALGEEGRAEDAHPDALRKGAADADKAESEAVKSGVEARYADRNAQTDLVKKGAEAESAVVAARYADQATRLDMAKKSEDIRASKENTRLRAIEAAYNREGNDLKRDELRIKLDEARRTLETKAAERIAEADTAIAGLDDSASLVGSLLGPSGTDRASVQAREKARDRLKTAIGGMAIRGAIPGSEARAVAGDLERLQNTLAAANLDKLKGAMSDKDIVFLKNISTNLDRYQDEDAFIKELERVEKVIADNRARVVRKYGEAAPKSAAPAATELTVDDLVKKYGGF